MESMLAVLLAGGAGERLFPLTRHTAKPAVSFGGIYRIIDFTLSNCINSDIRRIFLMTQYKGLELHRHVRDGWSLLPAGLGEFVEVLSPMQRVNENWYLGTADAVYQNLESIELERPEDVLILAGDHIYKMNYLEMIEWHRRHRADITIATIQIAPDEAVRFGVADISADYRVRGFEEKPKHGNPKRSIFNSDCVSASMGIYVFRPEVLHNMLLEDAADVNSSHDFGHNILPAAIGRYRVIAYDFNDLNRASERYWRDVGTLDAYYEANMDLVAVTPELNLYDERWPIRTHMPQQPPAKFVFAQEGRRMGVALDSIVSPGCIVSGGRISRSILSPGVRVNSYCEVEQSIILGHSNIGRYSRIRRAIIDSGVMIPEHSVIGHDAEEDRKHGYYVTESGITVVGKDAVKTHSPATATAPD
jgi:glucose-1-phosphate adenylyltransferase